LQGGEDTNIDTAYNNLILISKNMIVEVVRMDDLMTAVSLLESNLTLLQRCDNKSPEEAYEILFAVFNICLNDWYKNDEYKNVRADAI
jgi:hypothetical protein